MAATLQFVDQIASSPTVRLNLNDGTTWAGPHEGSSFKPPGLKYAEADTILNDGVYISASAYENRTLHLVLDLITNGPDTKATALRALNTELNRANNILKYQPGSTPLFFRTIRTAGYELEESPADNYTQVTVDIEAEPFAYGLRQDLGTTTVTRNPAVSNGLYVDVTGVNGDVDTPLFIYSTSAQLFSASNGPALATYIARETSPSGGVYVLQGESGTAYTDTTITASGDAAMSNGGYARTTFATDSTLTIRWTGSPSALPPAGDYRVLIRCRRSSLGGQFTIRQRNVTTSDTVITGPTVSWTESVALTCTLDLGLITTPVNGATASIGYGAATASPPLTMQIDVGRTAGTGTFDIDYVLLVPADEQLLTVASAGGTAGLRPLAVIDGPADAAYGMSSTSPFSGATVVGQTVIRAGSIPAVSPGKTTRLHVVTHVASGAIGAPADSITETLALQLAVWPRYLVV
ncbi:MAG TPA: hypothetical protein VFH54_06165 [Mycobacteriales bacterium]|nr:hypothetical protein [Mycobacteriales bacterium]